MNIIISNSSNIPIYEQLKEAIKKQILNNELLEDTLLPSIRSLAQDLRISVMTVKKSYDELEHEGYIITRHGKGSFVASKNLELVREEKQKQIEELLQKAISLSSSINLSKEEFLDLIDYLYEGEIK